MTEQKESVDGNAAVKAIKTIDVMKEAKEFVNDPEFTECIDTVMILLANPDAARERTSALIVRLEAWALKFRIGFAAHMGIQSIKDNSKKNIYKELYQGLDNLADALKYMVKGWNEFR